MQQSALFAKGRGFGCCGIIGSVGMITAVAERVVTIRVGVLRLRVRQGLSLFRLAQWCICGSASAKDDRSARTLLLVLDSLDVVVGNIDHVKGNEMADDCWHDDGGDADMAELPEAIANLGNVDTVDTKEILAIAVLSQGASSEKDDNEPDAACKLDDETDDQDNEEGPNHSSLLEDSAQESDEADQSSKSVHSANNDYRSSHILGQATELLRSIRRENNKPHQASCSARNQELEERKDEHSKSEGKTAAEFGSHC